MFRSSKGKDSKGPTGAQRKTRVTESAAKRMGSIPPPGSVCCIAWSLSAHAQAVITDEQLQELHQEIKSCASMVGAEIMEQMGSHGILCCQEDVGEMISSADTAIHWGQHLCRWAVSQDPPVGLRIGVHMGILRRVEIENGKTAYIGSCLSTARSLADTSTNETAVRFLKVTKGYLKRFEGLPFSVSDTGDSYFLEVGIFDDYIGSVSSLNDPKAADHGRVTATSGLDHDEGSNNKTDKARLSLVAKEQMEGLTGVTGSRHLGGSTMTFEDMLTLLQKYGVDINKFGQGSAKSLEELYQEVGVQKKSMLSEEHGKLVRRLELVRINLCSKDPKGQDRMLRLSTEIMEDGRMRTRNQKLAQVVVDSAYWKDVMKECFKHKLRVPDDLQNQVFNLDMKWVKTEVMSSPSFPGLETKYLTHEVRVYVTDPLRRELSIIGLPSMKNFTTSDPATKATWQWTWTPLGEQSTYEDILSSLLQDHGVDISGFKSGAFEELLDEVYTTKMSFLKVRDGQLERHLNIMKVWLGAEILSIPHVLVIRSKIQNGVRDFKSEDRPISMRMSATQTWEDALRDCLIQRLGLDEFFQKECLVIDPGSHKIREEIENSASFPGLTTVYSIHEVQCRIRADLKTAALGLPDGHEFAFSRAEGRDKKMIVTTYFCWKSRKELLDEKSEKIRSQNLRISRPNVASDDDVAAPDPKRRLKVPESLIFPAVPEKAGQVVVQEIMRNKKTDWDRAKNAAKRIRDKDYTCQMFYEDCVAAFPEIGLYMYDGGSGNTTTSGRSSDDEYQRTIGAMFAVYWLMRIDLDGAQSFTFGVDNNWKPLSATSTSPIRTSKEKKARDNFYKQVSWHLFGEVLSSAGMSKGNGKAHDEERVLAMLALTAIHDIMKVAALIPTVDPKHGEWCGYQTGQSIGDHDLALGYILEHYPQALPSYWGLPPHQRESVKFTQCKMEYNMGWLVQGEAPPGALFRKFKTIIQSGHASTADISFYFVHWLTDLAGAEPFPQEGSEKFVLKFPQKVLVAFLDSFPIVQNLGTKTETEVLEEYLGWRWNQHQPSLGPLPKGKGSIARQRLMTMSQASADSVLAALDRVLSVEDREVLFTELSRTGCSDQVFCIEGITNNQPAQGPAILVYYGPALMQKNATVDPAGALAVLAEVFRQSRALWPLSEAQANETVIVRIDALKELQTTAMVQLDPGEVWVLQRTSRQDAQVRRVTILDKDGTPQDLDLVENKLLSIGLKREAGDVSLDMHSSTRGRTAEEVEEPLNRGNLGPTCGNLAAASLCRWCLS
mmetsp:Transcript_16583/g.38828  ORF Transcript_16583/g.38828 Transcript_16583/m.38828 type:complete len:1285 (-) Transcript_16583:107-3961(-)